MDEYQELVYLLKEQAKRIEEADVAFLIMMLAA